MFSGFLLDPDFTITGALRSWARQSGFKLLEQKGNLLTYMIRFQRPA
jgi:hypothetical protein